LAPTLLSTPSSPPPLQFLPPFCVFPRDSFFCLQRVRIFQASVPPVGERRWFLGQTTEKFFTQVFSLLIGCRTIRQMPEGGLPPVICNRAAFLTALRDPPSLPPLIFSFLLITWGISQPQYSFSPLLNTLIPAITQPSPFSYRRHGHGHSYFR